MQKPPKNKIYATIGISGSGKTTFFKKNFLFRDNCIYINGDEIREFLTGDEASQERNCDVFLIVDYMLHFAAKNKLNIFYDFTCYNEKNRKKIENFAKKNNYELVYYYFQISLEEALERNNKRNRVVPQHVIENQYKNLTLPKEFLIIKYS